VLFAQLLAASCFTSVLHGVGKGDHDKHRFYFSDPAKKHNNDKKTQAPGAPAGNRTAPGARCSAVAIKLIFRGDK
jgi:hypothetical protein